MTGPLLEAPPNARPILKLYAVLSIDARGNNGVCGDIIPGIGASPLIGGEEQLHRLAAAADEIRKLAPPGHRIGLFEFSQRQEVHQ